jgi:acetyl esterase/lipase
MKPVRESRSRSWSTGRQSLGKMRRMTTRALLAIASIIGILFTTTGSIAQQPLLGPGDVNRLPAKPADARIAYGSAPEQFGDLRLPSGPGPFPLAIVIHGGCFVSKMATLQNSTAMADALRDSGLATWNIEYRRIGDPGGGWPGTFQDVALAADFVRTLMQRYPIDPGRVIAVGHSAGAFLSLWLGQREHVPQDSPLFVRDPFRFRSVVALGGDGDLLPVAPLLKKTCGEDVGATFFGDPPARSRLAQANPVDMRPSQTPQLLISGANDPFEPPVQKAAYTARVSKSGGKVDELTVPEAGHFEIVAPTSAAWPMVRSAIMRTVGISAPR